MVANSHAQKFSRPRKERTHNLLTIIRKFHRLEDIAYDINEICSKDVANVEKLTHNYEGFKCLLVAVDLLSRFAPVVAIRI